MLTCKRLRFFLSVVLIGCFSVIAAKEPKLKLADVKPNMEKIFSYHVENKELSPLLVKRSFKLYVEGFDADRFYLLKGEVKPFLEMNAKGVKQTILGYKKGAFSKYQDLNHLIQRGIERHRRLRQDIKNHILKEGLYLSFEATSLPSYFDYPENEDKLIERICCRFLMEIKLKASQRGIQDISHDFAERVMLHLERKLGHFEESYIANDQEDSYLALHILKAITKSLDAHSGYFSDQEADQIRAHLKKQFHGVGVVLKEDFDGVYVMDLVNGSPAHKCKQIQIGDRLTHVDGNEIASLTFQEVLEMLKGKEGASLVLGLKESYDAENPYEVSLLREKIIMDDERLHFTFEPFGNGVIGKITIPGFYDNGSHVSVEKDLKEALHLLKKKGNLLGVVLDIRENTGGFLSQAVKVAGVFINGGLIVISKYFDDEVTYTRDVDGRHYYSGPLVLLTSKMSASASEIVAQAIQDYGVGLVVGDERTYGKGSMQYQTITDEDALSFFKVTVGRYYTVSGRSTQIEGVKADIIVPTAYAPYYIGERYLDYPLTGDHLQGDVIHYLQQLKKNSNQEFKAFYVPYLQPRESFWRQMLSRLKENSQQRLRDSQDFQFFLKTTQNGTPKKRRPTSRQELYSNNFGVEDLQMDEAVEVIKDMILIQKSCDPSCIE